MKDTDGALGAEYSELNMRLAAFKDEPPFYEKQLVQFK